MSNEHIDKKDHLEKAAAYLASATGGRDVSQTKKVVRISGNYRGAIDTLALLSIAESLLSIAKSMSGTEAEPEEPRPVYREVNNV